MRTVFLALFILFSCVAFSQNEDKIPWEDERKLKWDDFTKRAGQGNFFKAYTYSGIRYTLDAPNDQIEINVEAYFLYDQSWVYRDFQTPVLLNHEQRHFDLAEVYARMMRAEMAKFEIPIAEFMAHDFTKEVEDTFNRLYDAMERKQKEYDEETEHGINSGAQQKWDTWIDQQLGRL